MTQYPPGEQELLEAAGRERKIGNSWYDTTRIRSGRMLFACRMFLDGNWWLGKTAWAAMNEYCLSMLRHPNPTPQPRGILLLTDPTPRDGSVERAQHEVFAAALGNATGRVAWNLAMEYLLPDYSDHPDTETRDEFLYTMRVLANRPSIVCLENPELLTLGNPLSSWLLENIISNLSSEERPRHETCYFIVVCHDVTKLPPEFNRCGRLDAFFDARANPELVNKGLARSAK